METEKNPLEAVPTMMIDTLEKSQSATQSYLDLVEKTMRRYPNANEKQVGDFKAYVEKRGRQSRLHWQAPARKGFPGSVSHSGRVLSISVEGRRRRRNSIRHQDGCVFQSIKIGSVFASALVMIWAAITVRRFALNAGVSRP